MVLDFIPPDLELEPSLHREVRRAVRKDWSWLKDCGNALRWLLAGAIGVIWLCTIHYFLPLFPARGLLIMLVRAVLFAVVAWPLMTMLTGPALARLTYRHLRERGIAVCPNCGYSLRDLIAAGRCPECGVGYEPV